MLSQGPLNCIFWKGQASLTYTLVATISDSAIEGGVLGGLSYQPANQSQGAS
jgi:hypothetical protein